MPTEMKGECRIPKETGQFSRFELIGTGAFAHVYRARYKATGTICALKSFNIKRKDGDFYQIATTEIAFIRFLKHPNIIGYISSEIKTKWEYILLGMEYAHLGCLVNVIGYGGLSECNVQIIMRQLLSALCHLHDMFIFHGDVKPDNVLVMEYSNKFKKVKLCDFGLAQVQLPKKDCRRQIGSFFYMSPEIHLGFPSDFSSDLYSAGVLMYEMMYGRKPFNTRTTREQFLANLRKRLPIEFPPADVAYSSDCFDLVKNLLSYDKQLRLKGDNLRQHQFLNISTVKHPENHYIKACELVISSVGAVNDGDLGSSYLDIIEAILHLKIHMNIIQADEGLLRYMMGNYKQYSIYADKLQQRMLTDLYTEPLAISSQAERIRCVLESTPILLTGYDICSVAEMYFWERNYTKTEELFQQGLEILFNNLKFEPDGLRKSAVLTKLDEWLKLLEEAKERKIIKAPEHK